MDVGVYAYPPGDPLLIEKIVNEFLSQGKFDKLRKECMSDADTKPAYQNLQQRVETTVAQFLRNQVWKPDLNKNQLRDSLRKHILESGFFDAGINRIVDQVVNPNVLATVFMPEVEEVVYNYLSIPKPSDKNQKRSVVLIVDEKVKPPGVEKEVNIVKENGKFESREGNETENGGLPMDLEEDQMPTFMQTMATNEKFSSSCIEEISNTDSKDQKSEENVKQESFQVKPVDSEKVEMPSEESENSLSRMGVESLDINETEETPLPDSDDSIPLEINEKSMSESRDSEDSIMNQMSPISQGRLTPELEEDKKEEKEEENREEKKTEKDGNKMVVEEPKRALNFIGRIPKIKREDSEPSQSLVKANEVPKKEKLDVKSVYSSDESDSGKSYSKSDSEDKKLRGKIKKKEEKKAREELEKKKANEERKKTDKGHDQSKDKKDRKREKSHERHGSKKSSSSSSSRERSSSGHKSSHQSKHNDSRKEDEHRRKEKEKKKSKSKDDHGKERKRKEDRRSTDRDSNERGSGGRSHGDKKGEKEQKGAEDEASKDRSTGKERRGEEEREAVPESEGVAEGPTKEEDSILDFNELFQNGAVTEVEFPTITDDFYVRFNSTGFKYFQEWEREKMDCEEEFKEFVDEAEADLSLLSDDDSDFECPNGFEFTGENQKIIKDLLKGLGNFRKSIMFDPRTLRFFKWTNNKLYQKHRKKIEKEGEGKAEKNESDESTKENIVKVRPSDGEKENRKREGKALHLRLLNRYRRRAMRQGKHRRRFKRKDLSGGIKEKNVNGVLSEEELEPWRLPVSEVLHLVAEVPGSEQEAALPMVVRPLPASPEDNTRWTDSQTKKDGVTEMSKNKSESPRSKENVITCTKLPPKCDIPLNLPPSPDSDDVNANNGAVSKETMGNKRKKVCGKGEKEENEEGQSAKKQPRRNQSQKYESQDLYKPRPVLNGSRTRGRGQRLGF